MVLPDPPPPPAEPPALLALANADKAFSLGEYPLAVAQYQNYLDWAPDGAERDRVLFRIGLSHYLPEPPHRDTERAMARFNQLLNEHPNSLYQPFAVVLMRLHREVGQLEKDRKEMQVTIQRLTLELDRLKQIDERSLKTRRNN
jgi:outer membrane protein assembly factor BamD (BamD/ComL family)